MKKAKLKTLGKITWDKIKINEVFANNGCWQIWIKLNEKEAGLLASNYFDWEKIDCLDFLIKQNHFYKYFHTSLYKLPKSVQKLWRED